MKNESAREVRTSQKLNRLLFPIRLRQFTLPAILFLATALWAQHSVRVEFTPDQAIHLDLDSRPAPAKITAEDEAALISKGYTKIGTVSASGSETEAAQVLDAEILTKAARAGGDMVHFDKDGALEVVEVPGVDKGVEVVCLHSHTESHICSPGDPSCMVTATGRTVSVEKVCDDSTNVPVTTPATIERKMVSEGTVWRYGISADIERARIRERADKLVEAIRSDDVAAVEKLLVEAPDLAVSRNGETPLHEAAKEGSERVTELLLAKGMNVNAKDNDGTTPLDVARSNVLAVLQKHGGIVNNINARGTLKQTSLHNAALAGDRKLVVFLLAKGADVNARDYEEETPLDWANSAEITQLLIDKGADVNAKDSHGWTPLHRARSAQQAKLLLAAGANVNATDNGGSTPLHGTGSVEVAEALLAGGANVNAKDNDGDTPLFEANSAGLAEILIANGADMNAKNFSLDTPLHYAAKFHSKEVVMSLLAKGADINSRSPTGQTALHEAAFYGNKDAVEALLARGGDINAKDLLGDTPLDLAKRENKEDVVELLMKYENMGSAEHPQ